jgi:hypothetical protein
MFDNGDVAMMANHLIDALVADQVVKEQ